MNPGKVNKRVVAKVYPWYNKEEFSCVYEALYSDNRLQNVWACNKVEVWKHRYYPAIPAGIEATAVLVRSIIHDDFYKHGLSLCKIPELCHMYSMGLIRFVNIVTEFVQGHERATPVRAAAKKLNIADWIVNLRHSASHSRMPSISMLRQGAQDALLWLRKEYWLEMERSFLNFYAVPVKKKVKPINIKELVNAYISYQTMCNASKVKYNQEAFQMLLQEKPAYERVLRKVQSHLAREPEKFMDAFVRPGLFLLSPQQMVNVVPSADIDMLHNREKLYLPRSLLVFWQPLIQIINSFGHMPLFLSRLLQNKSFEVFQQKMACAWALKLIKVVLTEEPLDFSDPIVSIFHKKNFLFHWLEVIPLCFYNASKYMPEVILTFINDFYPPLKEDAKQSLLAVLTVYLESVPYGAENSEEKHYTWKNTEEDAELQWLARHDGKVHYTSTTFEVTEDDIDWATTPLGVIIGSESDDFISGIPPEVILDKVEDPVMSENSIVCENSNAVNSSAIVAPTAEESIIQSNESQLVIKTESPIISYDYTDTSSNNEEMMLY